ncbi:hypothetical protein IC582_021278 [Cucumis melo]
MACDMSYEDSTVVIIQAIMVIMMEATHQYHNFRVKEMKTQTHLYPICIRQNILIGENMI